MTSVSILPPSVSSGGGSNVFGSGSSPAGPSIAGSSNGSTGASASGNFNISIPQWDPSGTGNQGTALSLHMNLPDPTSIANGAYSFAQSNFNADSMFLQNSITGSQAFLSNQIAPILSQVGNQISSNASQASGLIGSLGGNFAQALAAINQNVNLGASASLAASQASSQASASAAQSSGGGGCFLTTAVCVIEKQPDDCDTLQALRRFRDTVMLTDPLWRKDVADYYERAPAIADRLMLNPDRREIAQLLRALYIDPCLLLIECEHYTAAIAIYRDMVRWLEATV
jgi:hypothetical protein